MPRQVLQHPVYPAAYHQNHRPRESNFKSSRVRLPAINYGSHGNYCSSCWTYKCCNCSIIMRRRLVNVTFKAALLGALFLIIHYIVIYGNINLESIQLQFFSYFKSSSSSESVKADEVVNLKEQLLSTSHSVSTSMTKSEQLHSNYHVNIADFKNVESIARRLNVSMESFNDDYIFSVNKVKYLRFQNEMDVYWKSPLPLHEVKGVVLLFHNCKYNGQEWWSLLRDDITFEHYRFQYSLPNEIRIATGFLLAGYWVVALSPVKNQFKNGCWVKEDRVFIPAIAEYFRSLRILSSVHTSERRSSPQSSSLSLVSLFTQHHHHQPQSKQELPSVNLPSELSFFALGITNGGAFLNQHLKYWLNPIPDTPPPTHPYPQQPSKDNKDKDKLSIKEEPHIVHHGFAGRRHPINHTPLHKTNVKSNQLHSSAKENTHSSRKLDTSPLQNFLLTTQSTVVTYQPVQFEAIILMNAGIWHRDYFPSNQQNNKYAEEWAKLPPVLFVDYTRNGDVTWHNTQTMHQLQSLSETRQTILSATYATNSRKQTPFAKQVLSDPLSLSPTYFSDHLSVLYPKDISDFPAHRIKFNAQITPTFTTMSEQETKRSPFGADANQLISHAHHINISIPKNNDNANHRFTLPQSAVFTVEDSAHLFFALYFGDILHRDEVNRLHSAYQGHFLYPNNNSNNNNNNDKSNTHNNSNGIINDDNWWAVVSETLATHQRDGVERFIWPGSNILFKDVAGHIHLPRTVKLCHRSVQSSFFKDCDLLHELDTKRQDHGIHSPILQALRKAWGWRETNDEHIPEMVMWFNDHLRF